MILQQWEICEIWCLPWRTQQFYEISWNLWFSCQFQCI